MDMNRKLYRSNTNRMICGVCGGIGEYLNVDPTLVRLIWALVACSGAGVVAYLLAAVISPRIREAAIKENRYQLGAENVLNR